MAGLLLMTLSLLPIGLATSLQGVFTLICCFYLGSIIAEPARETLSASLADCARAAAWALAAWVWRWAARWVIPAAVGCTIPGGR